MARGMKCPICGKKLFQADYDLFYCKVCGYDTEGEDEGCEACGNPAYPDCKTSCPAFDD